MKTIQASAPGKVHIMGEHSVVYGKPAILAAINLRAKVTISSCHPEPRLNRGNLVSGSQNKYESMKRTVESVIRKEFKIKKIPSYEIDIHSKIPVGCGLGSSAAVSAAYIGALLLFLGKPWDLNLINKLTYEAEKVFHGNPSGADNAAVVFGNAIWFRKETDFLSSITSFPLKKTKAVLINSGKPKESTREMVDFLKSQMLRSKRSIEKVFDDQEELVKKIAVSFREGNIEKLKQLITQGQRNLEKLGVVGKKARDIVRLLEEQGFSAKIVGAGGRKTGSGMIICFTQHVEELLRYAKKHDLEAFQISLGEEGVRREV